jgi:ATP adenylyltransferase
LFPQDDTRDEGWLKNHRAFPARRAYIRGMIFPKDTLDSVWAPWRHEYFTIDKSFDFFTAAAQATDDAAHLVVKRGRTAFLMMNRYPYSVGHLMIVPYRKVADLAELNDAEKVEMFDLVVEAQRILREVVKAQGFNVGFNLGVCAGAGVEDYLHLHVVPRWNGDVNFMPVLGGTRVQAQALEEAYAKLAAVARA